TLEVTLSERGYPVVIGGGVLARAMEFIAPRVSASHAIVITDANVERPHAIAVGESLGRADLDVDLVVLEPGEQTKSMESSVWLWQRLLDLGADRKTLVVAVGGGVIGDLAGFVAATFARGLRLVQVPTTLLAQVDSSVGGKVGINLPSAKNMVGAFWQPVLVLCDLQALATLGEREYRSGLAEVVKYGVILDADFFAYLESNVAGLLSRDGLVLAHVVERCCRLKADVVQADEREETGLRAVLNYGHTFAHALETVTGYGSLLHGEAVAIGMVCASRLAERIGRIDSQVTRRQQDLLTKLGLPTSLPEVDREQLVAAMGRDKKVAHGRLRFVLPTRLGHVEQLGDIAMDDVRRALD
ncbi:MAG: 3-dehydroquinate synthase, partial [Pirellulales bacterium]